MNKLRPILLVLTAVAALSLGHPAKANTITTFNVSGTCDPFAPFTGHTFGGTLTIDVTTGTITAINVIFLGLSPFNTDTNLSGPFPSGWVVYAFNGGGDAMTLTFTTAPTPGSLVGFTGCTIGGTYVLGAADNILYGITGGSITAPPSVPDAGSTLPLLGCASLGLLALRRKLRC